MKTLLDWLDAILRALAGGSQPEPVLVPIPIPVPAARPRRR